MNHESRSGTCGTPVLGVNVLQWRLQFPPVEAIYRSKYGTLTSGSDKPFTIMHYRKDHRELFPQNELLPKLAIERDQYTSVGFRTKSVSTGNEQPVRISELNDEMT